MAFHWSKRSQLIQEEEEGEEAAATCRPFDAVIFYLKINSPTGSMSLRLHLSEQLKFVNLSKGLVSVVVWNNYFFE